MTIDINDMTDDIKNAFNDEYRSLPDVLDAVNRVVDAYVAKMKEARSTEFGLDSRAGYSLHYDDNCLVTPRREDRSLQYYGGFEYIDKECRREIGDWVVYMRDDNEEECRVAECLNRITGKTDENGIPTDQEEDEE